MMINKTNKNTIHTNDTTKSVVKQTRITSWRNYNKALIARGNIMLLVNDAFTRSIMEKHNRTKKKVVGHPIMHTDAIIYLMLAIKEIFQLDLRRTEGFTRCLFAMYGLDIAIPSYATLCRRIGNLSIDSGINHSRLRQAVVALVDSTGMQISGEGNWFRHKHGRQQKRRYIKEHILVDYYSMQIIGWRMTPDYVGDNTVLESLLEQITRSQTKVIEIIGDGAYDDHKAYKIAANNHINLLVPPPKNAKVYVGLELDKLLHSKPECILRNERVEQCRTIGRDNWKKEVNYHRRSLVETQMHRLKSAFSSQIHSKKQANQYNEMAMRIYLLNTWTNTYMPTYTNF